MTYLLGRHGSQTFSFRTIRIFTSEHHFDSFDSVRGEKKERNDSRNKYHTIEYASRYINGIHKFFPISEIGIELRKETVLVRSCSGIDERGERHEFEYRRLRCALYERTGGLLA